MNPAMKPFVTTRSRGLRRRTSTTCITLKIFGALLAGLLWLAWSISVLMSDNISFVDVFNLNILPIFLFSQP